MCVLMCVCVNVCARKCSIDWLMAGGRVYAGGLSYILILCRSGQPQSQEGNRTNS